MSVLVEVFTHIKGERMKLVMYNWLNSQKTDIEINISLFTSLWSIHIVLTFTETTHAVGIVFAELCNLRVKFYLSLFIS